MTSVINVLGLYSLHDGLATVMTLHYTDLYKRSTGPTAKSKDVMLLIIFGFHVVSAALTITHFMFKQNEFCLAYEKLRDVDLKIKALGKDPSYHTYTVISILMFGVNLSFTIAIQLYGVDRTLLASLCMYIVTSITSSAVQYYVLYIVIVHEKLKYMNRSLVRIKNVKKETAEIYDALRTTLELYDNLCAGMKHMTRVFSVFLFCETMFDLVQSMYIIFMLVVDSSGNTPALFWISKNVVNIVAITGPIFLVNNEIKQITRRLADVDLCYINEDMLAAKNTSYLEFMHLEMDFSCTFFKLTLSELFNQLPTCLSILLFLYQIARVIMEKGNKQ